jgi:hypothetical protein
MSDVVMFDRAVLEVTKAYSELGYELGWRFLIAPSPSTGVTL